MLAWKIDCFLNATTPKHSGIFGCQVECLTKAEFETRASSVDPNSCGYVNGATRTPRCLATGRRMSGDI